MFETILNDLGMCSTEIQERSEGAAFLKVARAAYPLASVAYVALNIPAAQRRCRYMHCVYSDSWLKQAVSHEPVNVQRLGATAAIFRQSFDWQTLPDWSTGNAYENERRATISLPLRTSHGETATFCLSVDTNLAGWGERQEKLARDFHALGSYFHQHMLRIWGYDTEREMLISARELECLKWIAEGKTAWEAGVILGISERTVRFHLNAAREKLQCQTTIQAVAKVVAQQLIPVNSA